MADLKGWIVETARALRAGDRPPATAAEAAARAADLRLRLRAAEGAALPPAGPRETPAARVLGTLERDGYRIERLVFETRPGVWATANTWAPTGRSGKLAAVLAVHGHWAGARRDPTVQARNIGLAKLGFFVLGLDAWGAGERGTRVGQNEYHGGLLGASLWPVGTPLHGLQLWDNVRALDYLQARPEVDPDRIGLTGASGGGNQTTYLSAFDERIRCAVPVCSVGTFQDYLNAACCVDEVLDGALTFAEEGDLLGSLAPRAALLVITAERDTFHFGPVSAAAAVERARGYFRACGREERLRHVVIPSGHDYNQPMREAMYGWMRRWLRDEGDGNPTPEPPITPEDPEALRCYPAVRPGRVTTTVRWVGERAADLSAAVPEPRAEGWVGQRRARVRRLAELLRMPAPGDRTVRPLASAADLRPGQPAAILAGPQGMEAARSGPLAQRLRAAGIGTLAVELRGCGTLTLPNQALGDRIPDHNLVEWSLWIGHPLLGQWVRDLLAAVDALRAGPNPARRIALVGWREGGLAALLATALAPRVAGVAAVESLLSFQGEGPPHNQRMAVFHPGLMELGDLPHLAGLCAPRRVLLAAPVTLAGAPADPAQIERLAAWPIRLYHALGRTAAFEVRRDLGEADLAEPIRGWLRHD